MIDGRATNRCSRECPHVPMGSGASWGELVLDQSADFYVGLSDIKGYPSRSQYFSLPDVGGDFVGGDPNFAHLFDSPRVAPQFRVLPVGWKWSFFFAQLAHCHLIKKSLPKWLSSCWRTEPPTKVYKGSVVFLRYCDNLAVGGGSQTHVEATRLRVVDHFREVGFGLHEEEDPRQHYMLRIVDSPSMA